MLGECPNKNFELLYHGGGGQVVSMFAFKSWYPSSNPAKASGFSV